MANQKGRKMKTTIWILGIALLLLTIFCLFQYYFVTRSIHEEAKWRYAACYKFDGSMDCSCLQKQLREMR